MAILPSIPLDRAAGLVLAEFTPLFDWLCYLFYLFYPITWALQIPEPLLVAQASALGVSEMFLPATLVTESAMSLRYVVAVAGGDPDPGIDPAAAGHVVRAGGAQPGAGDPGGAAAVLTQPVTSATWASR